MTTQQQTLAPTEETVSTGNDDPLTYKTCMIEAMTFQNTKVRNYIENHLSGTVLNACAGDTQLSHDDKVYRNDIAGERPNLDSNVDVYDLLEAYPESSMDTIVYDPPWTENQSTTTFELDDDIFPGYTTELMEVFNKLLTDDGKIITMGYTTDVGLLSDDNLPYSRPAICIVNTFGRMYDVYITVNERHPNGSPTTPVSLSGNVVMNAGTDQPSRKTQQEPFQMEYHFGKSEAEAIEKMQSFIDEHTVGWTLDLYSQQPTTTHTSNVFHNEPPDVNAEVDPLPHFAFEPDNINRKLSHWGFDTIIFNPNDNAVFRNYTADSTGVDRAIKEALNPRLRPEGTVIQVGPTTTLMPNPDAVNNGWDYRREAVGLFSYPGSEMDIAITVDQVNEVDYLSEEENRWERFDSPRQGSIKYRCIHCQQSWYASEYPALMDADCVNCGAHQGETYCMTQVVGLLFGANPHTPREGICMERENYARKTSENMECPNHEYGHVVMSLDQWSPTITD